MRLANFEWLETEPEPIDGGRWGHAPRWVAVLPSGDAVALEITKHPTQEVQEYSVFGSILSYAFVTVNKLPSLEAADEAARKVYEFLQADLHGKAGGE